MKTKRGDELFVGIRAKKLVIEIPLKTLKFAIENGPEWGDVDDENAPKITDMDALAKEIVAALEHEEEDGSTPVHHLLDAAAQRALENGADGVEYP